MEKSESEMIHDMLAEHNTTLGKTFYYSEEEVRQLCRYAFFILADSNMMPFEDWWNDVKKK